MVTIHWLYHLGVFFFFFFRAEASGKLHRMRAVAFTRLTFCKVTSDDIFHATVHSAGLQALDLSLFCIFFPRCKDGVNAVSGQITSNARPLSSSWDRKARQLLKRQLLAMREGGRSWWVAMGRMSVRWGSVCSSAGEERPWAGGGALNDNL